jgi:DNA-binding NarL/FixJ family response regulator
MRPKNNLKATSDYNPGAAIVMALKCAGLPARAVASPLTSAENRVLALVTQAKTNKEIARDLGISPATVKRHLENVLDKLGLRNRVQAAVYGILVSGCASAISSGCALQAWCKDQEMAPPIWADRPGVF